MNTIIAIWNSAGKGKSSTLLALANLIMTRFPTHKIIYSSKDVTKLSVDFSSIIEIKGKIIAIESQGDPGTKLEIRLERIANKYEPNHIFCTCRTRGETVHAVEKIANTFDYDTIWSSTYQVNSKENIANLAKSEHLLDLITKLGLI